MNCGGKRDDVPMDEPPRPLLRDRSEFGDNRSIGELRSMSMNSQKSGHVPQSNHYHDEPEADYDNGATDLYRCIEGKDWDGALSRLDMAPIEAKTWVSRREAGSNKTRWRLLPLHAVCIFRAPLALIETIIEVNADGPKMKDDQGMLPIHLACRNGASKGVVLTILNAFPESINVRDRKGRLPVDLVSASNSQNKETVLSAIKRFSAELAMQSPHGNNTTQNGSISLVESGSHNSSRLQLQNQPVRTHPSQMMTNQSMTTHSHEPSLQMEDNMMSRRPQLQQQQHQQVDQQPSLREIRTAPSHASSREVDYEHRTVLFRMVLKKDWEQAGPRAIAFPEEAATWIVTKGFNGNLRFLPIHKACVLQPPADVIDSLVKAFPEGAESKDQDGWLPVHCACFYGADGQVVNHLLDVYPRGAHVKDDEGRLPLHYACLKGASLDVVQLLLASHTKGAMAKDEEGRLAIHHACSKGAPEAVIDALLKASPKGAQSKDDQGRLPLHHACRKMSSERAIRTLLRVYPRSAQIKDDQDKLAIHYACTHGGSLAVIHLLLKTYPESISVKNGFGHTPLGEVKALNNPKMDTVVKLLEKFKKEHVRKVASGEEGGSNEVECKMDILQKQISSLEKNLGKVGILGKDLKSELRKGKDPSDILDEFADKLIALGKRSASGSHGASANGSSGTPLKKRQSTPGRQTTPGRQSTPGRSRSTSKGRTRSTTPSRSTAPSKGLFGRMGNRAKSSKE